MAIDFIQKMMENIPEPRQPEYIQATQAFFSREQFENKLNSIGYMDSHELYDFIKTNIEYIEKCVMNKDMIVIRAFFNLNFVKAFYLVVSNMPITVMRQFCVNRISYDYFTSEHNHPDIKHTLLEAAKKVNAEEIKQLMAIGLDIDTAANLALCRYSSISERVNVKRLNFVICSKDPDIMTEQMVVWIYEKLFDRLGELFVTTMLEYYVTVEAMEDDSSFMEIMSTIYNAILIMANNMSMSEIHKLLNIYVREWEYAGRPAVKVSLRSLSADFGRIGQVVEELMARNIYVP